MTRDNRQTTSGDNTELLSHLKTLMLTPALSGYEGRVRRYLATAMQKLGYETRTDNPGNLISTLSGDTKLPSVMLYTHMDQLGFIVRSIRRDGFVRVERLGGVPERALASQEVLFCIANGADVSGILANKSHHATTPDEKYRVVPIHELYVDAGFCSREEVLRSGIDIGTPVVYAPRVVELENERLAGTTIDDRAGCAVMLDVARQLKTSPSACTVHLVFSVQEEYNLRGAMIAARQLKPDMAIQLDLMQSCDTPDMTERGDVVLGGGPAMSLYSFHGRGTLNGTIAHPALVRLFDATAKATGIRLQRSAQSGVLTDNAYVQLEGNGIAAIDMGFPMRYSHSSNELCAVSDLVELSELLVATLRGIDKTFNLDRDNYIV